MKSFRTILLSAFVALLSLASVGELVAQDGPGRGGRGGGFRHDGDSSIRPPKGDRDSIKHNDRPGHGGRIHEVINFFVRKDSCREVLMSQMSAEDAAALTELVNSLKGRAEQIHALRQQARDARAAGDTAAFRALSEQLKQLHREQGANHKAIAELLKKYEQIAMRVRKDCGGRDIRHDKRDKLPGDSTRDDRQGGIIVPNPVPVGGTAVLNLRLETETSVGVTISNENGTVLTIPAAPLAAGAQQIALDVSTLSRGVYMVQVQMGDRIKVYKLMIG